MYALFVPQKNEGRRMLPSGALHDRLVPSPRYFAKLLLLTHDAVGRASADRIRCRSARRGNEADDVVFHCAEAFHAGDVKCNRNGGADERGPGSRTLSSSGDGESALGASGQRAVND